jgi:hypothetical protein
MALNFFKNKLRVVLIKNYFLKKKNNDKYWINKFLKIKLFN